MDGEVATETYGCPSCGYRHPRAGGFQTLRFDQDLNDVRRVLSGAALDFLCSNCSTPVHLLSAFIFSAPTLGLFVGYMHEATPERIAEIERKLSSKAADCGLTMLVTADMDEAVRVIRRRLVELANQLVMPAQIAYARDEFLPWLSEHEREVAREQISAQHTIAPFLCEASGKGIDAELKAQLDFMVGMIVLHRILRVAHEAVSTQADPIAALDEVLAFQTVGDLPREALIRAAERTEEEHIGEAIEASVALAWLADHGAATLPKLAGLHLAAALLVQARDEQQRLLLETDFTRRVIPISAYLHFIAQGKWSEQGLLIMNGSRAGLFRFDEILASMRLTLPNTQAHLKALALELPLEHCSAQVKVFVDWGWNDEACEVLEARWNELVGTGHGARIAQDVCRGLWTTGRSREAGAIGQKFLADSEDRMATIPASFMVGLLNELGNIRRQDLAHVEALALYERAEKLLPDSEMRAHQGPVLLRNMAIIWRETGQPARALRTLLDILDELDPSDDIGLYADLLRSIALCLEALGETSAALEWIDEAIELIRRNAEAHPRQWVELLSHRASATPVMDRCRLTLCEQAAEAARVTQDYYHLATAEFLMAETAISQDHHDACDFISAALSRLVELVGQDHVNPQHVGGATIMYFRLLVAIRALPLAESLAESSGLDQWDLNAGLAELRAEAGDTTRCGDLVKKALRQRLRHLQDPYLTAGNASVLAGADSLRKATAAWLKTKLAEPGTRSDVLLVAEATSNAAGGLLAWAPERRREAVDLLLFDTDRLLTTVADCVVVWAVASDGVVHVFVSREGRTEDVTHFDLKRFVAAGRELRATTSRSLPDGDPVAASPRWRELAAELGQALAGTLAGAASVVLVDSQAFQGLPLHLMSLPGGELLCQAYPCTYVGGLLELAGVRSRDASGAEAVGGVIAIPRWGDTPLVIEALSQATLKWQELLSRKGLATSALTGTDADRVAVSALLGRADLLLLACHGRSQPLLGQHGLLVAQDDQLPPVVMGHAEGARGRRFLLSWDELAPPSPAVVLSAACSSGSRSFNGANERIGFGRTLIANGTQVFFGPAWDADLENGLALTGRLAELYFEEQETWARAWQRLACEADGNMAPAAWQSFTLHGNWRYRLCPTSAAPST